MKITGVIAEYNPFHNGHLFQFEQIRRLTGADYIIVAMSGDFVQRGEPAIYDKYTRASMALRCGADLVLELPAVFATSSAEDFASCGVALLDHLGVVNQLCFGSECGDLAPLQAIAELLCEESEDFSAELQTRLKQGLPFPAARAAALAAMTEPITETMAASANSAESPEDLLASPNNILAVEYLKALRRRQSRIEPFTILREGQAYHDSSHPDSGICASASALRHAIRHSRPFDGQESDGQKADRRMAGAANRQAGNGTSGTEHSSLLSVQMPSAALEVLRTEGALQSPVFADDLSGILQYRLLELAQRNADFSIYADMSPELAARLSRLILNFATFSGRIEQLKTRQYTYTRISRALLHLILGITSEQMRTCRQMDYAPYARVLGFRQQAAPLLREIKKQASIPLITKTADAGKILDGTALSMLQTDFHASHLYQSLVFEKGRRLDNEYTKSVIVLP